MSASTSNALADERNPTVAIIGCGVVGRSWMPVFARAGCMVRVHDANRTWTALARRRHELEVESFAPFRDAITLHDSLEEAIVGAHYVQECVPEDLQLKQRIFRDIDAVAHSASYLASSTSSLDINEISSEVADPGRCFTAHPFNPASLLPVVEVLGTKGSTPEDLAGFTAFLRRVGQTPIVLRKFVPGYIGNRLQAAIMREALHLVADGVTTADGIDALLSHALALRWVPLGVFGTNHTNDDAGLLGYYARFGQSYQGLMATLASAPPSMDEERLGEIAREVEQRFGSAPVAAIATWRDMVVQELRRVQQTIRFTPE